MKEVTKIIIDFDGVLTDGKVFYTHDGKIFKGLNTRDVRAIRELISLGYDVVILTASSWPGSAEFAKKTGSEVVILKEKNKYIENIKEKYIAIGDDVWDASLIEKSERFFAPKDCDKFIKNNPKVEIIDINGGDGVIAELVWILKKSKK
jgi:3-deoxy-D-manno-octulosonate 8-phosphate phosphatase (KDO 8-P phosphatase)